MALCASFITPINPCYCNVGSRWESSFIQRSARRSHVLCFFSTSEKPLKTKLERVTLSSDRFKRPDSSKDSRKIIERRLADEEPSGKRPFSAFRKSDGNGLPDKDSIAGRSTASVPSEVKVLPPTPKDSPKKTVDVPILNQTVQVPGRWLLFAVPFMWGSFGPAVRLIFSQHPQLEPSVFNTARLMLSSMVYLPVLGAEFKAVQESKSIAASTKSTTEPSENRFSFLKAGIELGIYVFLANVAQVIGLEQTSAGRAAFLVQLQTVIVPVVSGFLGLEVVGRKTLIASVVAVLGVALLSMDKGHGSVSSLTGDSLEVLSALFFSAYIVRLGNYCNNVRPAPLVATKILVQAVLSTGWALGMGLFSSPHAQSLMKTVSDGSAVPQWTVPIIAINVAAIAWTGLISSAVSGWVQTKGQQAVSASEAVVIFATQPLWASAIAALILGEGFGPRGIVGGGLIVASTLVAGIDWEESFSELLKKYGNKKSED